MKRFIGFIAAVLMGTSLMAQNYDYKPRESWPYLLEGFTSGQVHTPGGLDLTEGVYNVSVVDGKLHYVQDGRIMAADMRQVQIVRIGESIFINRYGKLYQCLSEEQGGNYLLLYTSVDMEQLGKTDIGYGISSATASTQKLSSVFGSQVNMELSTAIAQSKDGQVLPLDKKYCFLLGSKEIPADKKSFLELPGIDKAKAKAFLKEKKIKWSQPESLSEVLRYIVENSKQ